MASNSGGACEKGLPLHRDTVSPGGIRAESRYVFPDGSVRQGLETPGRVATTGDLPMPLVGTSRMASADLSLAIGIDALGGGADGGSGDCINETPGRGRRRGRSGAGGAYRGPGAAPGADWAPGGRPPRAYVPFLNLPKSNGKASASSGKARRHRQDVDRLGGSISRVNSSSIGGVDSTSLFPFPFINSVSEEGRNGQRGRPLAGVGGLLVSPGRVMLTGPGRPGTGASSSTRTIFGDTDSEYGNLKRSRRRSGSGTGNRANRDRSGDCKKLAGDDELSDGSDSLGSGSTDVEYLRRRAEAKLRSLDRREAANLAKGKAMQDESTGVLHKNVVKVTL